MTAKATTVDETEVGETFINITTHQPLVVRPILPASLTAGDQVHLSAIVHNYSEQSVAVDVFTYVHAADSGEGSSPSLQNLCERRRSNYTNRQYRTRRVARSGVASNGDTSRKCRDDSRGPIGKTNFESSYREQWFKQ